MAEFTDLLHAWNLTPTEAVALQRQLRGHNVLTPLTTTPRLIAGADISYNKFSEDIYAAIIFLDYTTLQPVLHAAVKSVMSFPYIPGLLSFREIPALAAAWLELPQRPDVIMLDGQGIAHPRRMGIATHFGLITGCPSLGCGKTLLTGRYTDPPITRGSYSPLVDGNETIGYALRTKDKVNPVFISPGYGLSLDDARRIALQCAAGYRIPEPTRQAHLLVNAFRRGEIGAGVHRY